MTDRIAWCIGPPWPAPTSRPEVAGKCGPAIGSHARGTQALPGVWDPSLDESSVNAARRDRLGMRVLELGARLGLSLFLTAGFAAASRLNRDAVSSVDDLAGIGVALFLWSFALIGSTTGRR